MTPADYDMEIHIKGIRYCANYLGKDGDLELSEVFVGRGNGDNLNPGWRLAHKFIGSRSWQWSKTRSAKAKAIKS